MIQKFLLWFISKRCYNNIDVMPCGYWDKLIAEDNLSYLFKSDIISIGRKQPNKFQLFALSLLYRKLQEQFVAKFGFGEIFLEIIRKQNEISELIIEKLTTDNKTLNTFIGLKRAELENIKKQMSGGMDFMQCVIHLKKHGYNIEQYKTSVTEYQLALRELQREIKANG